MNALTEQKYLSNSDNQVDGELLHLAFPYGDGLDLNLYGYPATEECGFQVRGVTATDSFQDISILFNESQLECMGEWLDFKDRTDATGKSVAELAIRGVRRGKRN